MKSSHAYKPILHFLLVQRTVTLRQQYFYWGIVMYNFPHSRVGDEVLFYQIRWQCIIIRRSLCTSKFPLHCFQGCSMRCIPVLIFLQTILSFQFYSIFVLSSCCTLFSACLSSLFVYHSVLVSKSDFS